MTKPLAAGERQRRLIERQKREMAIYKAVKEGIEAGAFKLDVYESLGAQYGLRSEAIYQTYRRVGARLEAANAPQM
jgi:hypothetical protein